MKKYLCEQIMDASVEDFKKIIDYLDECRQINNSDTRFSWIDIDEFFICEKCKEMYGCDSEKDTHMTCIENFRKYCELEA